MTVTNGLFRSTLTAPSGADLSLDGWYLSIRVEGNALTPRERLTSSVYSLQAASAAYSAAVPATGVQAGPLGGGVIVSSVAVGAVRDEAIVSVSAAKLTGTLPSLDAGNLYNLPAAGGAVQKAGDVMTGPLQTSTLTVAGNAFSVGGSTLSVNGGFVGVGTDSPSERLEVNGYMKLSNGYLRLDSGYGLMAGGSLSLLLYNDYLMLNNGGPGALKVTAAGDLSHAGVLTSSGTGANYFAGTVGIATRAPQAALDVVSTGTAADSYAQIWRDGSGAVVSSVSATGVMKAAYFEGNGSRLSGLTAVGDSLGNHVATTTLQMGSYGVVSSSAITAAHYQISGSTVLALSAGDSVMVGPAAGPLNTGNQSVFFGAGAGALNQNGGNNTFVGYYSGSSNVGGASNTFVGDQTGAANSSGNGNVALGYAAGFLNTSGSNNVFIGNSAGYSTNGGTGNIVIGAAQNTSASGASEELNIGGVLFGDLGAKAIGISTRAPQTALDVVSSGAASNVMAQIWRDAAGVVVGSMSAAGYMTASHFSPAQNYLGRNAAILAYGDSGAGKGANVIFTGADTGLPGSFGANGWNSAVFSAANAYFAVNNDMYRFTAARPSLMSVLDPVDGSFFVAYAPAGGSADSQISNWKYPFYIQGASGNIGVGNTSPEAALDVESNGAGAGTYAQIWRDSGGTIIASMTSTGVLYPGVAVAGDNLGSHTASQPLNMNNYSVVNATAVSAGVLQLNGLNYLATDSDNTLLAVGNGAGRNISIHGTGNTTLGGQTLFYGNAPRYNTVVGYSAAALTGNIVGNTVVGWSAGGATGENASPALVTFSSNTVVGSQAGYRLGGTASNNTLLGFSAGYNIRSGSNNIVIGYAQDPSDVAASNELNIGGVLFGNLAAKTIGISTRAPQAALDVVSTGTASDVSVQLWRNSNGVPVATMTATGLLYAKGEVPGVETVMLSGTMSSFDVSGSGLVLLSQAADNNNISAITGCDSGAVKQGQRVVFLLSGYGSGSLTLNDTPVSSLAADNMVLNNAWSKSNSSGVGSTITLMCATINSTRVWVEISQTNNSN